MSPARIVRPINSEFHRGTDTFSGSIILYIRPGLVRTTGCQDSFFGHPYDFLPCCFLMSKGLFLRPLPFPLVNATLLHLSHNYQLGPRGATASLMSTFKKMGCTTMFVHEREKGEETEIQYGFQDFVCDGIIYLQLIRRKEAAEFYRGLTILKMRKTNHGKGTYPFHIEAGGIRVYPDQRVF
jgi:hypothetical protein